MKYNPYDSSFQLAFEKLGVPEANRQTIFRYDDTNPEAESTEYIQSLRLVYQVIEMQLNLSHMRMMIETLILFATSNAMRNIAKMFKCA